MLHLDGILFPHINDDARSKSHQTLLINEIRVGLLYVNAITYSELVKINTISSYLLETSIQLFTLYGHINLTVP